MWHITFLWTSLRSVDVVVVGVAGVVEVVVGVDISRGEISHGQGVP